MHPKDILTILLMMGSLSVVRSGTLHGMTEQTWMITQAELKGCCGSIPTKLMSTIKSDMSREDLKH